MTIDQAVLGRRLRLAREASGLTQVDASEAIGLPRTAVVQMEAGNRAVSSLELARLARLYGHPIDSFFAEASEAAETPLHAIYRAAPGFEQNAAHKSQFDAAVSLCREGVKLEQLLGHRARFGPPAYDFPLPRRQTEAVEQGSHVAAEERRRLELGDAPIADMADLITTQQIWASGARFPDEVSGVFMRNEELGMVILVNFHHVRGRKRFSYAHEYAHALFDRQKPVQVSTLGNRKELCEVRANAFAAAFLMPRGGVVSFLRSLDKATPSRHVAWVYDQATEDAEAPIEAERRAVPGSQKITYKDVATLARHFGVSYKAAAFRIRNLNWVNFDECNSLLEQEGSARDYLTLLDFSDSVEGKDDAPADRELRRQVAGLAIEAFRREQISRGRLLELSKPLGVPGSKLLKLAEAAV